MSGRGFVLRTTLAGWMASMGPQDEDRRADRIAPGAVILPALPAGPQLGRAPLAVSDLSLSAS
jgi:hypothetical protein